MGNNIPLAEAVPVDVDSVSSNIPIVKADPSAPPTQIAPDDIREWPLIKVYGVDFRRSLVELKKTIDVLELWDPKLWEIEKANINKNSEKITEFLSKQKFILEEIN